MYITTQLKRQKISGVVIVDSQPPKIENITVSNITMNYDHDGTTDPASQSFVLRADITDQGSGLASTNAVVSFDTGRTSGNNVAMQSMGVIQDKYEWRYVVAPTDLTVNAAPSTYTFKITANPSSGSSSEEERTATASL